MEAIDGLGSNLDAAAALARKLQLLGVASGSGAGMRGAEQGPRVLRAAGLVSRLRQLGRQVEDLGDVPGWYAAHDAPPGDHLARNLPNIVQVNRHIHAAVVNARRADPEAFLLIIGGDHSLAIGTLAGLADSCNRLGLIWIDAHPDLNTPETTPSGNIHGMSVAVARDDGPRPLREIASRQPLVLDEDVWMFALRDVDEGEQYEIEHSDIHAFSAADLHAGRPDEMIARACRELSSRCDHVHLSFDIDALEADLVPGTGTPVPGGLTRGQALEILSTLRESDALHSAEFVEFNPRLDPTGATGRLTLELISELLSPGGVRQAMRKNAC